MAEPQTEPSPPSEAFDRGLRRASQLIGLLVLVAEVVWVIDAANGHRFSLVVRLKGRHTRELVATAGRRAVMWATAGPVSKREAPAVLWEAWAAAEGRTP